MNLPSQSAATLPLALGLDVGGTATRWALAGGDGRPLAQGECPGLSGARLLSDQAGVAAAALDELLAALGPAGGRLAALCAGVTGTDRTSGQRLQQGLAQRLGLDAARVELGSDIEMACRTAFAPGGGYLVYAGTGSIAGFLDAQGQLHRAGGRGVLIDDAGSAHWIAVQALRGLWRAEDAEPGAWQRSALARRVLPLIGGDDWPRNRAWLASASRGDIGLLARAVADTAHDDAEVAPLMDAAGTELARLALALIQRFGPRPVALAGRAFGLSPRIAAALRAALPSGIDLGRPGQSAEQAAAQRAAAMLKA